MRITTLNPEEQNRKDKTTARKEFGTFKDSLKSPVHRWFTYPAGFSYKAVEEAIKEFNICPGQTIFDPFVGTGTTQVVAKKNGIDSIGIEAHPFIHEVARIKLYWGFDFPELHKWIDELEIALISQVSMKSPEGEEIRSFPELVRKCYSPFKLARLSQIRKVIEAQSNKDVHFRDFCWLALACVLRKVADVQTGWPYIAPKKPTASNGNQDVVSVFCRQLRLMEGDLENISCNVTPSKTLTIKGDARIEHPELGAGTVDFGFTSPPYLNNYDYADRTRLETYFFGMYSSWGDITLEVRSKLITAATTQINRSEWDVDNPLSNGIHDVKKIYPELQTKIKELSVVRLQKGGKKGYDLMVAGYFNDMYKAMEHTSKALKPGSTFIMILGDSAPYGIHITTEVYLGEIGLAVGFSDYRIEELRRRGDKWHGNPQRHKVALRESLLILQR